MFTRITRAKYFAETLLFQSNLCINYEQEVKQLEQKLVYHIYLTVRCASSHPPTPISIYRMTQESKSAMCNSAIT